MRFPSWSLIPPPEDPSTLFISAGMQPLKPYFSGPEGAAGAALHDRPKGAPRGRQGHRSRRGRADRASRVDVRDARQLLVRRLLQGRRDRLRLGVRHRAHAARPRTPVGVGLRGRSGARPPRGRRRGRGLDPQGRSAGADRRVSPLRELLGPGGRHGPVWSLLGAPLRPRRGARLRPGRLWAELRALRPLHRVLEPRLHGVRPARGRLGDAAAEAEHRHRDGARAQRDAAAGSALDLRHGRLPPDHGLDRERVGRPLRRVARRHEGAPRDHRPRPRHDVPGRGGDHAVERGPRLRDAAA